MFRSVGSGTGPTTFAPVRWTCSTMSRAATSSIRWSYARGLMRSFGPAMSVLGLPLRDLRPIPFLGLPLRYLRPIPFFSVSCLLQDLRDASGADRSAALADREPEAVLHRDRRDQLDGHL